MEVMEPLLVKSASIRFIIITLEGFDPQGRVMKLVYQKFQLN